MQSISMKGQVIKMKEKTKVFATDKHQYATSGDELTMHPTLAEYLIKKGWVTKDKPKEKAKA